MEDLERELTVLIVTSLELEDVTADAIDVDAPLFAKEKGLSLDSIDALELSVALSEKYGVTLKADEEETHAALSSVRSLARYISQNR